MRDRSRMCQVRKLAHYRPLLAQGKQPIMRERCSISWGAHHGPFRCPGKGFRRNGPSSCYADRLPRRWAGCESQPLFSYVASFPPTRLAEVFEQGPYCVLLRL